MSEDVDAAAQQQKTTAARLLGRQGGLARARNLSPAERQRQAIHASQAALRAREAKKHAAHEQAAMPEDAL